MTFESYYITTKSIIYSIEKLLISAILEQIARLISFNMVPFGSNMLKIRNLKEISLI